MGDNVRSNPITFAEFKELCKEARIDDAPEHMETDFRVGNAMADVTEELYQALEGFPAMNSAHEGYAVLLEEVKELEDHIFTKQGHRDVDAMRKEAVQVAAMAIRFIADICHDEKGQN